MSIYGNPVMLGGSGGGGGSGNAYAYTVPPTASVGENGEYYFELNASGGNGIASGSLTGGANTGIAGWEFTALSSFSVIGLRGYARQAYTGTLVLGTTSAQLVSKSVQTIANDWAEVMLDEPIQLTAGTNYIVMLFGNPSTLSYNTASGLTINSKLSYVCARYGSFPGNTEANNVYSADIIIGGGIPPYPIRTQYYKTGGVWVAV